MPTVRMLLSYCACLPKGKTIFLSQPKKIRTWALMRMKLTGRRERTFFSGRRKEERKKKHVFPWVKVYSENKAPASFSPFPPSLKKGLWSRMQAFIILRTVAYDLIHINSLEENPRVGACTTRIVFCIIGDYAWLTISMYGRFLHGDNIHLVIFLQV